MSQAISDETLRSIFGAQAFQGRVGRYEIDPGRITPAVSQATLYELSRLLAPANILEIGSYFGNTSKVLAESIADAGAGSFVTIDPFGADRLPHIVAGWPERLQAVTSFHALTSMSYFASLEVVKTPTGKNGPFNLVFVDGHHSYEYALFDLLSSALYLRPGGAIVMDNVEQAGPAMAVEAFLASYRAWRLFSQSGAPLDPGFPESVPDAKGAILLAPPGVEVGKIPHKFHFYGLTRTAIPVVRVPLIPCGAAGTLTVSANFYSLPYDHHITGKGLAYKVAQVTRRIGGEETAADLVFGSDFSIQPTTDQSNITMEMELRFEPEVKGAANIIVDVARDMELP